MTFEVFTSDGRRYLVESESEEMLIEEIQRGEIARVKIPGVNYEARETESHWRVNLAHVTAYEVEEDE